MQKQKSNSFGVQRITFGTQKLTRRGERRVSLFVAFLWTAFFLGQVLFVLEVSVDKYGRAPKAGKIRMCSSASSNNNAAKTMGKITLIVISTILIPVLSLNNKSNTTIIMIINRYTYKIYSSYYTTILSTHPTNI